MRRRFAEMSPSSNFSHALNRRAFMVGVDAKSPSAFSPIHSGSKRMQLSLPWRVTRWASTAGSLIFLVLDSLDHGAILLCHFLVSWLDCWNTLQEDGCQVSLIYWVKGCKGSVTALVASGWKVAKILQLVIELLREGDLVILMHVNQKNYILCLMFSLSGHLIQKPFQNIFLAYEKIPITLTIKKI